MADMYREIRRILDGGMAAIASIVSFVTAIVTFIKLIGSDTGTVMTILSLLAGVASTVACGYLAFARESSQTAIGQYWWKFPRWRKPALVGLVIMPILTTAAIAVPFLWPPSWSIVAVADFAGPDPLNTRLTEYILKELRLRTQSPIKVKALGRAISEQEGSEVARANAKQVGARILLWGWYGRTNEKASLSYHVEFINDRVRQIGPQQRSGGIDGAFTTTVKNLDIFESQQKLAERLADEVERKLAMETHRFFNIDERVGHTDKALDGQFEAIRTRETNLGNFIADAFREVHNADIALVKAGEVRIGRTVGPGSITKQDVIQMLPFGNTIVKVQVSGAWLEQAIESGLDTGNSGFLQVSGIKITYDPGRPIGNRLVSAIVGIHPLKKKSNLHISCIAVFYRQPAPWL